MNKKFRVLAILFILILAATALIACRSPENTVIDDIKQDEISASVSVTQDKIKIRLISKESEVGNAEATVIGVKPYEYLDADVLRGLSQNVLSVADEAILTGGGTYKLGTDSTVEFDRYAGSYDRLYDKYYVVCNGKLLKGPLYATEIESKSTEAPKFDIKSKKGILGQGLEYFKDLNCSYTVLNFDVASLMYPNEMFEGDEVIELAHPDEAIEFTSNGKNFYFNPSTVNYYDREVKKYYDAGAHITAVVYANSNITNETFPEKMTYMPYAVSPTTNILGHSYSPVLVGLNTSNVYGFEYVVALMEFFAERYSTNGFTNGHVANFVIGNEIDYARDYNKISEHQAEFDVYMEEYSRLLRIANLAVKKYHKDVTVCVPFTQAWASTGYDVIDSSVSCYTPKKMVEWLNKKTKLEGDYDWGIAPHCYTSGLAPSPVFLNDTLNGKKAGMTNDYETSSKITFSNLEILDSYLNLEEMQFNGKARNVYLTESGVSTHDDKTDREYHRNNQAASIAAIWYKVSQLDCIKAFSYYRMIDHPSEVSAFISFGVLDVDLKPKPSYQVFKYIDTQYSKYVAKDYLKYNVYVNEKGKEVTPTSYEEVLDVFQTGYFDGKTFDWNKATPVKAETVYEWEDEEDLSAVVFDSVNYLYDGTEKRLEALNVPSGVTVSYDVEPVLTEVGFKDVVATFSRDGHVVGRRKARLSISKLSTNKTVYNFGEKVFVSVEIKDVQLTQNAWVGIYKKGAEPGNVENGEISYFYFYVNSNGDEFIRTYCLQETISNKLEYLPEGDYVIYFFDNDEYSVYCSVEIKVLPEDKHKDTVDLGGVRFESKTVKFDGNAVSLEITGELPQGVTVRYINNTLEDAGTVQAVAVFEYEGRELERRYAVLTVISEDFSWIKTDKSQYLEGEDVLVTAFAPNDSQPETWWVGMYPEGFEVGPDSLYWYYVKDANHVSGATYNIRNQSIGNTDRWEVYGKLPKGKYKIAVFNTSGYTIEEVVEIEIISVDLGSDKGTLSTDKTNYSLGESIMVTATDTVNVNYPLYAGLFTSGAELVLDNVIYSYKISDSSHVSGRAYDITKETLNPAMSGMASLPVGKYKIVTYAVVANKPVFANQINIQIGSDTEQPTAGTLLTDKTEYKAGESIYVTAYAAEDSAAKTWWVGLYLATDDYSEGGVNSIKWYYVNDSSHVSGQAYDIRTQEQNATRADLADVPAGDYILVLYNTSGYTVETVVSFKVV